MYVLYVDCAYLKCANIARMKVFATEKPKVWYLPLLAFHVYFKSGNCFVIIKLQLNI